MASLRRLPNSPYWIACFSLPDGRRTQRSTKTSDRKEAQRIANKYEDASGEGKSGRLTEVQARKVIADIFSISNKDVLPSSTIKSFLESWLKRKELEATEKTHSRYKTVVDHLLQFLGPKSNFDIAHLTSKEITAFRDDLAGHLTAGTVNLSLKILRTALSQARREGAVDSNEAERVSLLKNRRGDEIRRPFTLEELKKILANANQEWRGMILVGLYTGLRLSDVATLTWLNVDLQRQELSVTTSKTGRRQILPLAKPVLNYLQALPSSDRPDQPLFSEAFQARQRSQYGGTLSNQFYQILVAGGLAIKRTHESLENGNRNGQNQNGSINGNGQTNGNQDNEAWNCSRKQKDLIQKIVTEHNLDKKEIETLAQDRFGKGVKELNKLEASGLIEELFEKTGQKGNGRGRFQRAGGR